jgi:hypothetical protein
MLTNQEIQDNLEALPTQVANAAEKEENARYEFKKAELQLKASEARRKLELKAIKVGNKKQSDNRIDLQVDQDCLSERIAVLQMESTYRKAKLLTEKLEKEYDSMKALAYLKQRELKNGID